MYNSTVAELMNGIILAKFEKSNELKDGSYQTEQDLENQLISNLVSQGYEYFPAKTKLDLLDNLKSKIERLNNVNFTKSEWDRFMLEYLDSPNDGIVEKTRKIQEDYVYDFTFDNSHRQNIKIIDKDNIHNNYLQVVNQIKQVGEASNRYDVSILVNGLPLVHIELKKRGVNLHEAFNQIHRYSKESFNSDNSLYKYTQIFVISNGTYTRYFANTTLNNKGNYEFTCEWADAKNKVIRDLEDFTATFFEQRVLLEVLTKYCVFDTSNTLLIMRPYQIAAAERILWKIKSSYENKKAGSIEAGGYIWHTTGSGKTLTSFKTARLASKLNYIDKVLFVVDRKDLDAQTQQEYKKFEEDSINGSINTRELKKNIEKNDGKIVVTTLQKLNEFMKKNPNHPIYDKHCVLIFDECHRSQFGEAQKNIKKLFKKYYQFGFTGTPIFVENSISGETTDATFGVQLHSYVITDAIRDGKVLKFKVDYTNVYSKFKNEENDEEYVENSKILLHPDRIRAVTEYILKVYDTKTHRNVNYSLKDKRISGFNAMFAVQSVEAAKLYYEEFKKQQLSLPEKDRIKVATIFSFAENEGQQKEETFNVTALDISSKEFLNRAIEDYDNYFGTNYKFDEKGKEISDKFQNYYNNLSKRVKNKEVDLLIVVGMFLTGFDAPTMNTLFVDKNLRYHGLIQAYSRTNRILNSVKTFGNIICFRNLEKATEDAIKTFGDKNNINIILEKSYKQYMDGFKDELTGEKVRGYIDICTELNERFPDPQNIQLDKDKKDFIKVFGEFLTSNNILKNFDDFSEFKPILSDRQIQDMRSAYLNFKDELRPGGRIDDKNDKSYSKVDFSDIEFKIDLLRTDEINLDYILELILKKSRETNNVELIKEEIRRVILSNIGTRSKENLIIDFINSSDLTKFDSTEEIIEDFYNFAKKLKVKAIESIIIEEGLRNEEGRANKFINKSISKGYAESAGENFSSILPLMSRRAGMRAKKKEEVLNKINELVEIYVGI